MTPVSGDQRQAPTYFSFAHFVLDLKTHELRHNGRRLRLAEKPFLVLATLLEHPGELVTRAELRRRLWADDTFVDFDNNLNSAVASLRAALGDTAHKPRFIETVPRLGYRFVGALNAPEDFAPSVAPAGRRLRVLAPLGLAAAVAVLVGAGWWMSPTTSRSPTLVEGADSQAYVDGLYLLERGDPEGVREATTLLERATVESPSHAAAHSALGEAWLRMTLQALTPKETGFARAEQASRRTLELEPASAAAHRTQAMILLHRDWDFAMANRESALALEADPGDARNHLVAAMVKTAGGQPEQAIAAARRAIALDPRSLRVKADLAFFLLSAGHYQEAANESRQLLALEPKLPHALDFLLTASERLGRFDEARRAALELMQLGGAAPAEIQAVRGVESQQGLRRYRAWQARRADQRAAKRAWSPMTAASIYASAGQADKAFIWLRRAYEQHDVMFIFLASNPDLATLRHDPRFSELAQLAGVPQNSSPTKKVALSEEAGPPRI